MPTSTVEDYLKCILLAEEKRPGEPVATGLVASELGVSPGTATAMFKTLGGSGLAGYEPYNGVRLTEAGNRLALHVLRRHRLVELFLVEVMGMDWSEVHPEAERLEHAVSDRLIERMDEILGHPSVDPHGDPIPGPGLEVEETDLTSLAACAPGDSLRVGRVTDQSREFLRLVEREDLKPGSRLTVRERDSAADTVELELANGRRLELGLRAAGKILVEIVG